MHVIINMSGIGDIFVPSKTKNPVYRNVAIVVNMNIDAENFNGRQNSQSESLRFEFCVICYPLILVCYYCSIIFPSDKVVVSVGEIKFVNAV